MDSEGANRERAPGAKTKMKAPTVSTRGMVGEHEQDLWTAVVVATDWSRDVLKGR